jgi:magnesium chelatase subunit I
MHQINTLAQLRSSPYHPCRVKDELRRNLLVKLRNNESLFPDLVGYDDSVIPELVRAILARHDILLLGTRGQGKTKLLRSLHQLLDEQIPVVAGCDLRDDPLAPVSRAAKRLLAAHGDDTPIQWLSRQERYSEKLATPDVTMADLFGDIDLRKHVQGRSLADEESLHFGLIPRANRGLFCINELPDLAPKIQVGLFNLLQERDIQIRGYPVRFDLDVCLLFSANPEDYTGRGRMVTPLKDRIGSVIHTHDPRSRENAIAITDANVPTHRDSLPVAFSGPLKAILEEIVALARLHPSVSRQSGVSARMSITVRELVISQAEIRAVRQAEPIICPRMCDLVALFPGGRGKMELLMGDEEADEDGLLRELLLEATRNVVRQFSATLPLVEVCEYFKKGVSLSLHDSMSSTELLACAGSLAQLVNGATPQHRASALEFLLESACVLGRLTKTFVGSRLIVQGKE